MVTYFNKKDLVSFGNYLLSDERRKLFEEHPEPIGAIEERLKVVNHSDIENWKHKESKPNIIIKWLDYEKDK